MKRDIPGRKKNDQNRTANRLLLDSISLKSKRGIGSSIPDVVLRFKFNKTLVREVSLARKIIHGATKIAPVKANISKSPICCFKVLFCLRGSRMAMTDVINP